MHGRPAPGEVGLALLFALTGIIWILGATGLPFWEGFAPQSGFLPFIYGALLTGLAAVLLVRLFLFREGESEGPPMGKPLVVLAALAAAIVGVQAAGFGLAVFLMLVFLFVVVERRRLLPALAVAVGTTAGLVLVFRTWLGVPLPKGPLGL